MKQTNNFDLSEITSFRTGGLAENYIVIEALDEFEKIGVLAHPFWIIGDGANILVSDEGLPGTTIHLTTSEISFEGSSAIVDAGYDWDEFVLASLDQNLWGIELMSGIPGSVGAAVAGNIAAYGQAVADSLQWVETIELGGESLEFTRLDAHELDLAYRSSKFNRGELPNQLILRACFELSTAPTTELKYETAQSAARELGIDADSLENRRNIILAAREKAGSLVKKDDPILTAGSFFKNPLVDLETSEKILEFEERDVTKQVVRDQHRIHGGDQARVSASLVLLAAGFKRGQSWGSVRLHPDHILKIENTGGATSQEIYDVAQEITSTVYEKLGIRLEPEVRFLGNFSHNSNQN